MSVLNIRETLRAFIRAQDDGAVLDYLAVEQATGVAMDLDGRAALRSACKAENRGFQTRRGKCLELTSPSTVLTHQQERVSGIRKHVERVSKASEKDLRQHAAKMSTGDQQKVIRTNAFLTTVRMSAALSVPLAKVLPVYVEGDKAAE
jgi:hypothetical protein